MTVDIGDKSPLDDARPESAIEPPPRRLRRHTTPDLARAFR